MPVLKAKVNGVWTEVGVPGPAGADGVPGPTAVSADAGNSAVLGTDGLVYVPVSSSGIARTFYGTAGTHNFVIPVGAKAVRFQIVGGGHGGGAGYRGAPGTVREGGWGGGGAGSVDFTFDVVDLPAAVDIIIGTGGAGGVGQTADNTFGASGTKGTISAVQFAGVNRLLADAGGQGAGGDDGAQTIGGNSGSGFGTDLTGAGGPPDTTGSTGKTGLGMASLTGSNGELWRFPVTGPNGGGGGGGVTAAEESKNGGMVSAPRGGWAVTGTGSAGGVAPGGAGANAVFPANWVPAITATVVPGLGGGGGAGNAAGNGGNGGNGYWGGGGGGGGACSNGFVSGAGGRGGDGIACVTVYFGI